MEGAVRGPETAAERELKARFSLDYMTKANQRRQIFAKYLDTLGTQGILDVLEERNTYCHNEAHELGRAVYARFKDLGKSLSECGSRCTSACLHGVLKEAFGNATIEEVRPRLATVCTEGAMNDIRRPGNCAHGMGHALMLILNNDVEKSVDGCKGFNDSAMEYYCVTGIYMELFDRAPEWDAKGAALLYPCDTYTRFPAACYRYQGARLLRKLGGDREKLAETCRSLPASQRPGCFHGFGFANLPEVSKKPELMAGLCPDSPAEDQTMCIEGVIESLAAFNPSQATTACSHLKDRAGDICKAAAQEGTYRLKKPSLPLYLARQP